jgi:predicted ester cyclase
MSAEHNKAATLGALEELNGPLEERMGYFELYAPDVVLHGYPFGITDLEGLQAYYAEVWEACPDARLKVEDVVTAGDKVVLRFTWHGTPDHREPIAASSLLMLRFEGGKVVERWQESCELARLAAPALAY